MPGRSCEGEGFDVRCRKPRNYPYPEYPRIQQATEKWGSIVLVLVLVSRHLQKAAVCPPSWCPDSQCALTYVHTHRLWASNWPIP